jgi:hypothetical protein
LALALTALSTSAAAGSRRTHPPSKSELAPIILAAIHDEDKALKAFDAGKKDEAKKDLEKSIDRLKEAMTGTSGTTKSDLNQAKTKDDLAIKDLPKKHERERVRSLINHAIVNKQFALEKVPHAAIPPKPPPKPQPPDVRIATSFELEESETVYTVPDRGFPAGATITYEWTLIPPAADPACNNLGHTTSTDPEFAWVHGPGPPPYQNNPGNCDHSKEGPLGHQGTVKVVVTIGRWRCEASIDGTEGGRLSDPATCKYFY